METDYDVTAQAKTERLEVVATIKLYIKQTPLLTAYYCHLPGVHLAISQNQKSKYYKPSNFSPEISAEYQKSLDWIIRYKNTLLKKAKLQVLATNLLSYAELVDLEIITDTKILMLIAERLSLIDDKYYLSLSRSLEKVCEGKIAIQFANDLTANIEQSLPTFRETVKLVDVYPKNEFELLKLNSFTFVEQTRQELSDNLDKIKYSAKLKLLKSLIQSNSLTLSPQYSFEAITEPADIDNLQNLQVFNTLQKQNLSPYYGYDFGDDVDDSIQEMMVRCFDMSYELYSKLIEAGFETLAQMSVLVGHRQHFGFTVDIHGLTNLLTKSSGIFPEQLIEAVGNRHPSLLESLRASLTSVRQQTKISPTLLQDSDHSIK